MVDKLFDHYPLSRRKAERAALSVLETVVHFYEVAAQEEE